MLQAIGVLLLHSLMVSPSARAAEILTPPERIPLWAGGAPEGLRTLLGDWPIRTPEECIPFVERMPVSPARDTLLSEMGVAVERKTVTEQEGAE